MQHDMPQDGFESTVQVSLQSMLQQARRQRPRPPSLLRSSNLVKDLQLEFSNFELDADNYHEAKYAGIYGPLEEPCVWSAHSKAGQSQSHVFQPYSLHFCMDPAPRPEKFPLFLEARMLFFPPSADQTLLDLETVPHLVLEGLLVPFSFDQVYTISAVTDSSVQRATYPVPADMA